MYQEVVTLFLLVTCTVALAFLRLMVPKPKDVFEKRVGQVVWGGVALLALASVAELFGKL